MTRCLALLVLPVVCLHLPAAPVIVLANGILHDGTGAPGRQGNLVIEGERIRLVGAGAVPEGARVIDVSGMIVAPGFIDLHTHSDNALLEAGTCGNLNYLLQGVTSVVTGNCGSGPTDVAAYYKHMKEHGVGSNVLHQVPHNDVRRKVMGNANRPPTAAELKKMEALVEQGMKDGAWGLSTGLIYNPGTYSKTDELITLAKVVAKHDGFYASHIRNEGVNVLVATDEILTIGREAGLPVHISHMKASGRRAWGKAGDQVAMVLAARKKGQVVTADQYPYVASSTSLSATVVPPRFREGSRKDYLARFDDAEQAPRLRTAIADALKEKRDGLDLRIASYTPRPEWAGKDLAAIAKQEKKDPVDLVIDIEKNGGAGIVNFGISEEDMKLIMRQEFVATASDGGARVPGPTVPHPRSYGTFPRKIGRFALEEGVVSLEQAVRSASGLPADILHLKDRGYLKKGFVADVVVFDAKTFRDRATFDQPHLYATGVQHLFVNGTQVIRDGRYLGVLAGKPLLRQEHERPRSMKRGVPPS
jgi:N-acyl-D-amino-acid deacylase